MTTEPRISVTDIIITGSEDGNFSNWEKSVLDYFEISYDNNLAIITEKMRDSKVEEIEVLNEKGEKNLILWTLK